MEAHLSRRGVLAVSVWSSPWREEEERLVPLRFTDCRGSTAHTEEKGERRVQVRIRMIKSVAVAKQKQN